MRVLVQTVDEVRIWPGHATRNATHVQNKSSTTVRIMINDSELYAALGSSHFDKLDATNNLHLLIHIAYQLMTPPPRCSVTKQ